MSESILRTKSKEFAKNIVFLCRKMKQNNVESALINQLLRSRTPEVKAQILSSLVEKVFPKIETGEIKPTIHAVLPITEAEAAHDILYKGQNVGKVVLKVK